MLDTFVFYAQAQTWLYNDLSANWKVVCFDGFQFWKFWGYSHMMEEVQTCVLGEDNKQSSKYNCVLGSTMLAIIL